MGLLRLSGGFAVASALLALLTSACGAMSATRGTSLPLEHPSRVPVGNGLIAYVHRGTIYTVAADGAGRKVLSGDPILGRPGYLDLSWSPDGRQLAAIRETDSLVILRANGTAEKTLIRAETGTAEHGLRDPSWSPDGNLIAVDVSPASFKKEFSFATLNTVEVVRVRDRKVIARVADAEYPSWAPNGATLYYEQPAYPSLGALLEARYEAQSLALPKRDTFHAANAKHDTRVASGVYQPAVAPNGKVVAYIGDKRSDLMLMRTDGSDQRILMRARGFDYAEPAWSPDGRRILVRREYGTHGSAKNCCRLELWSVSLDGRAVREIWKQKADEGRAAWQPRPR